MAEIEHVDVATVLSKWGCNLETIQQFQKNDICYDVLINLNESDLREILPHSLGMRKLILLRIKEIQENKEKSSLATTVTVSSDVSIGSVIESERFDRREVVSQDLDASDILSPLLTPTTFPDFELNTLLQTSPMGNSIIKYYATNKVLDNTRRARLVEIICKHVYTYIIKHRLRHDEYNKIASKIIGLFPTECMGTYYVAAIRKRESVSGKSVLAKGKLVDKVRNIIRKCDEAEPRRSRKQKELSTSVVNDSPASKILKTVGNNEDYIWLKINREPWSEVLSRWERTYFLREPLTRNGEETVAQVLEQWPALNDPRADVLINIDFRTFHPEKECKLFQNWDKFIEVVLNLKQGNCKDPTTLEYLELRTNTSNKDGKFLIELVCLPYLIPPKGRIVTNKKHWKFSTVEVVEAIVLHAKSPGDLEDIVLKQKEKAYSRQQTVQPYLLFEGSSIQDPRTFYIVLDSIRYQLGSSQKAFDVLFKLFQVFNAKYPVAAEYIYLLIQKGIYDISYATDKCPPYILDILDMLSTIKYTQEN